MSLSEYKKRELYEYYSEYGFQQPTDDIADKLRICHKTFFNRYGNKANSIELAWQYWQELCRKKWLELMQHCNHSIEALTMTLFFIHEKSKNDPHYYTLTRDSHKYLLPNSFFNSSIQIILLRGKQCFHIHEDLNLDTYIPFLLNNLFLIEVTEEKHPEVLRYILTPALTERGMELFLETPFAS
jgi:hypothetical protein